MFKNLQKLLLLIACIPVFISATYIENASSESYDIAGIYEMIELESGSKSIDQYGKVKKAEYILVPTKLDTDTYEVRLTRIDNDFYQIYDTNIVIETRYCYKYANREKVILNIKSNYSYSRGEVIFLN